MTVNVALKLFFCLKIQQFVFEGLVNCILNWIVVFILQVVKKCYVLKIDVNYYKVTIIET